MSDPGDGDNIIPYRRGAKAAAPATPVSPRKPMDWAKLATQTPPIRTWSVSNWLTDGPTLFAGAGGIGKTLVAQTLATALAARTRYLDDIEKHHIVLFWACEDDHDELWRRQVQICAYLGVRMEDLADRLILEPRFGLDNTLYATTFGTPQWTPLKDELRSQLNDYAASVLFLDNIGQTFGAEENKRHHVTSFINGISGLVADYPFSPVIMGHPAKAADSEFAGNAAWENAVRMRWFMGQKLPDQQIEEGEQLDPKVRYISKRKTNYSVKDYRKLIYSNGVFAPEDAPPGSFQMRFGNRDADAQACVVEGLRKLVARQIRTTHAKNTSDYLPKVMRTSGLAADFAPSELDEALAKLRLAGKIVEGVVGKYDNRTRKTGLVLP